MVNVHKILKRSKLYFFAEDCFGNDQDFTIRWIIHEGKINNKGHTNEDNIDFNNQLREEYNNPHITLIKRDKDAYNKNFKEKKYIIISLIKGAPKKESYSLFIKASVKPHEELTDTRPNDGVFLLFELDEDDYQALREDFSQLKAKNVIKVAEEVFKKIKSYEKTIPILVKKGYYTVKEGEEEVDISIKELWDVYFKDDKAALLEWDKVKLLEVFT